MNKTIAIPVGEYHRLRRIEKTYDAVRNSFARAETGMLETPPVTDAAMVLKSLKASGKYSAAFLRSLSLGLKDSKTFGA